MRLRPLLPCGMRSVWGGRTGMATMTTKAKFTSVSEMTTTTGGVFSMTPLGGRLMAELLADDLGAGRVHFDARGC